MMDDESIVEKIRHSVKLADEVAKYTTLKPAGNRLKGLCPFPDHHEKTPSFFVDPLLNLFKCFGCGKGGDLFTFVMEMEHLSFPEALELLAHRYHIELPKKTRGSDKFRKEIFEALKRAQAYYAQWLEKEGKDGLNYLSHRGFGRDVVKAWGLGWAGSQGNRLYSALKVDFSEELLKKAGLIIHRGGQWQDFFRQRLLIPLRDRGGRVVGFAGRTLGSGEPKYLNSPETEVFKKQNLLFGFSEAKGSISRQKEAWLVEGYFDCIQLHQAGFTQTVATMGTAVGKRHGDLLKNLTDKVLLCFDGDSAGVQAALRALVPLLEAGLDVDVLLLPEGKDPDDFLKDQSPKAFHAYMKKERKNLLSFLLDYYFPQPPSAYEPLEKIQRTEKILGVLRHLKDELLQREYLSLLSQRVGLPVSMLKRRLPSLAQFTTQAQTSHPLPDMESRFLVLFLKYPEVQKCYQERITPDHFTHPDLRKIMEERLQGEGVDFLKIRTHLLKERSHQEVADLFLEDLQPELAEKYFLYLEKYYLQRRMHRLQEELRRCKPEEKKALWEEKMVLGKRLVDLQKQIKQGGKKRGMG